MTLTRSQIESWAPSELTDIGDGWTKLGTEVESLFQQYVDAVTKTGADYWEGETAEAAQSRALSDRSAALEVVDRVNALADRARQGFHEVDSPLQRVRLAILGAETDCLIVSESLFVSGGYLSGISESLVVSGLMPVSDERQERIAYWQQEISDAALATELADHAVQQALASGREGLLLSFTSAATLGGEQGSSDAAALATDPSSLSPEQQRRLVEAGHLTPEQLEALSAGETTSIPASQMEYLERLGRAFDGKSPQEIADIIDRLPSDAKAGVADALQILSNDNVSATVVGDSEVPTKGGFDRLPDSIRESLTRDDLVVSGLECSGNLHLSSIALNGVADNQAIAQIVAAGNDEYKSGSTLDSHLLDVGRQYLDAQVRHEQNPDSKTEFFLVDGYGTQETRITEDIFAAVGPDKVAVLEAVTDPEHGQDFVRDTLSHNWSDDGDAVSSLFSFEAADSVVTDPGNPADVARAERTGGIMSAVGEAIATDDWDALKNVPEAGGQSVGQLNPQLLQTLGHSMSPYIPDLAGMQSDDRPGFDIGWVDPAHTGNYSGSAQVFALMNTDTATGTDFIAHTNAEILAAEGRYAEDPRDPYSGMHLTETGTLHGLTDKGVMLAMEDQYEDDADRAQAEYDRKSAGFDAMLTLTTAGIGEIPVAGGYANTMIDLVGDPLKESLVGPEPGGPQDATLKGFDMSRDFYNMLAATPDLPPDVTSGLADLLDENGALRPYENRVEFQTGVETMFNRLGNPADGNFSRMLNAYQQVILKDG